MRSTGTYYPGICIDQVLNKQVPLYRPTYLPTFTVPTFTVPTFTVRVDE